MNYFLKIIDREAPDGCPLLFVVDGKGKPIPRQINIQIEQGIESDITMIVTAFSNPKKLRKDKQDVAKITMYFTGKITFQDKLEQIHFTLQEVIEEKTIDDK